MTKQTLKALFPAIVGTILEYYDYALYGFCAHFLAMHFFPNDVPAVALMKAFGIFLIGSVSKLLGALIFGYIGDRFGRQIALQISIVGIAIPTAIIGGLPTYADIGWVAPCALLICRILQGIFTSGESDGVRIFIYETVGTDRPCLANSLSGIACMLGIYLASLAASMATRFEAYPEIWRVPFFIGGFLGFLMFFGRSALTETPDFIQYSRTNQAHRPNATLAILSKNKAALLATILLCGSAGGLYHFYMVFFGHYLANTLKLINSADISFYTTNALLIYTVCGPIAGLLADRFGPVPVLKLSLSGLLLATIFNLVMIYQGTLSIWTFWVTAIMISSFATPGFIVLLQQFKVHERYRCLSIGHATGSMLFSGSAPIIGFWFWHATKMAIAPLLYVGFLILIGFLAIFLLEHRGSRLNS